jgi:hypothetical protein
VKSPPIFGLVLAIALAAGCTSIVGADFDRPGAPEASEAGSAGGDVEAPDGASSAEGAAPGCTRDDAADCAQKCGRRRGRCGQVLDCGGCANDQTCGGGGPNVCGTGSCTPTCAGRRCGESDNCAGLCSAETCGAGLACVNGACVCGDATHACTAAPPAGWGGPFALYEGPAANAPPPCAAPFASLVYEGKAGLSFKPATCSACTCTTPIGATCSAPTFAMFSKSSCGTQCGTFSPKGTQIATPCTAWSFKPLADAVVTGGSCTAIGGNQQVQAYSFDTAARGCAPPAAPVGCGGGLCVPKPSAPFASTYCIYNAGELACPSAYPTKHVYYQGASDTRTCTACACGAPAGGTNACTWRAWFYASGCSGGGYPTDGPTGGRCDGFNSAVTCMDSYVTGPTGTLSCPPSGGQSTGTVTATGATTICCAP